MKLAVNGIDLHWETTGDGEPLLWLHGALGHGADWRHVFGEAPPGCQVIAPDLRGHGASTNPSGAFTFAQCARDVRALLDHLGISRVKAIGLSGGGLVLLHIATADPGRIAAMVLVSAPPYFPEQARAIQRQFSRSSLQESDLARMRASHVHGDAQIDRLLEMVRGFAEDYQDVNFTPPSLARITADTLIVFGDRDPLYPVSIACDMYRAIPKSFLWVVPNGGHGPVFLDDASPFAAAVLSFLSGAWR